ncbi:MAG: hypothetical protein WA690_05875 [Candidatus Acidiferrales bacterium]
MRTFELFTQLPERNPIALPANLEQSQRDLAFTMLPNLDRENFAARLGRLVMVLTVPRVAHPPKA